jgi:hypothetical protein
MRSTEDLAARIVMSVAVLGMIALPAIPAAVLVLVAG